MIKEIGEAKSIEDWIVHVRGNPLKEAELIQYLLSTKNEEGKDRTQHEVAKMMSLSQGGVSKRLRLLNLIPELQNRVLNAELLPSTAYQISRLPQNKQREFLKADYVTLVEASEAARQQAVSKELLDLLESPLPSPEPKKECVHEFVCIRCGKKLKE